MVSEPTAKPLTAAEEERIRASVSKHAFGWQNDARLLATIDREREAAAKARAAVLGELAAKVEALTIVSYSASPYSIAYSDGLNRDAVLALIADAGDEDTTGAGL